MDFGNIASTFSPNSDLILADIMKKYSLGEPGDIAELILTKLTMDFSRGEIQEKDMAGSIQKELGTPAEKAKQISEELKTIIPTLWDKMPEEEKNVLLNKKPGEIIEKTDVLPKIKMPIGVEDILEKPKSGVDFRNEMPPTPRRTKISKEPDTLQEKRASELPQKTKRSGPDKYRESVE